jgi:hypothetical protein
MPLTVKAPPQSYFPLSDYIDHRVLAAATAEAIGPPVGAHAVIISTDQDLYVRRNATATVPSADVTDGSGAALIPAGTGRAFELSGVTTLSFISAAAAKVTLEWLA